MRLVNFCKLNAHSFQDALQCSSSTSNTRTLTFTLKSVIDKELLMPQVTLTARQTFSKPLGHRKL
ncbi:hypothetical protein BCON_0111g00090 [Botryotinia convoluta]|uniref:Uncharacterized protein n=1 Tax=Botryotinia convoluta TaxID=54673 RepID=A0A4Z1HYL4_9HELO|nr:hypothetical protein BCON_0111g00090 [Botryotinia convoluta]